MDYLLCWRGWLENGEDRTVNIFTVSFFGHRIIPEFREAEDRVEALVHALLLEKEYASTITNINEIINNDFFIITSIFYLHNEQSGLLQG